MAREPLREVSALDVLTRDLNDFARAWHKQQKQWREAAPSPSLSPPIEAESSVNSKRNQARPERELLESV